MAISGTSTTIDRVTPASVATSGRKEYKSSKGYSAMNSCIHKVGVIGIGLMGSGIAQVAGAKGFDRVVVHVTAEILINGLECIRESVRRIVERFKNSSG